MTPRSSSKLAWLLLIAGSVGIAGCRIGFELLDENGADLDASIIDADVSGIDANTKTIIPIAGAGVWGKDAELRRDLAVASSNRKMTFSSWYFSNDLGAILLGSGVSSGDHTFIWAGSTDGQPVLQRHGPDADNYGSTPDTGVPWPYNGSWYHLIISIDMNATTLAERTRYWINGLPVPPKPAGNEAFPQGHQFHFGSALPHALGNKANGEFDWSGMLAETYIIWGEALEASEFVRFDDQGQLRSVQYTGPVTTESVYFNYASDDTGNNAFAGQPDWLSTNVQSSAMLLPY